MYFGICVTIIVTASWVGVAHCIKLLYLSAKENLIRDTPIIVTSSNGTNNGNSTSIVFPIRQQTPFKAAFFTTWFCTNFTLLFFPIYLLGRAAVKNCERPSEILGDVLRGFRDRGFTIGELLWINNLQLDYYVCISTISGRFLNRCIIFSILWVLTTYLYVLSLKTLTATDVITLFATNVTSVYLLSWVILHEQFVGVRIVAVILCDTGIALLAYMVKL